MRVRGKEEDGLGVGVWSKRLKSGEEEGQGGRARRRKESPPVVRLCLLLG